VVMITTAKAKAWYDPMRPLHELPAQNMQRPLVPQLYPSRAQWPRDRDQSVLPNMPVTT